MPNVALQLIGDLVYTDHTIVLKEKTNNSSQISRPNKQLRISDRKSHVSATKVRTHVIVKQKP